MSEKRVGIMVGDPVLLGPNSHAVLAYIEKAENMGISAAWCTTSRAGLDALTLFAGAAGRTRQILFGTAIVTSFPRHPVVMAQQVQVLNELAPGRIRLGVGTGHRGDMEETFGADFRSPLGHLGEYLYILKTLLQEGSVDFDGRYYSSHTSIETPVDVPVMASALQPKSFELCGAGADGAITWVCPASYLRDVALPAMKAASEKADRPMPPLIYGGPACVHDNPDEVKAAIREQLGHTRLVFYQRMLAAAGFPEAFNGTWSDAMIDAVTLSGSESQVKEQIEELFSGGVTEIMACPVAAGIDQEASVERTLGLLAEVSNSMALYQYKKI